MDWNAALPLIKSHDLSDDETVGIFEIEGVLIDALQAMDGEGYTLLMHAAILQKKSTAFFLLNRYPPGIVHLEGIREKYGEFISSEYFSR